MRVFKPWSACRYCISAVKMAFLWLDSLRSFWSVSHLTARFWFASWMSFQFCFDIITIFSVFVIGLFIGFFCGACALEGYVHTSSNNFGKMISSGICTVH